MIRWTTPTIKCKVPEELVFDFILMTVKQGEYVIERMIAPEEIIDSYFSVFFTQEETSEFELFEPIEVQLNAMRGGVRIATNINELCIERNLHDEYINPDLPTTLEITENGRYNVVGYFTVDVNVEGTDIPDYEGSYVVIPKVTDQILDTQNKKMTDDLTIKEITYSVFDNEKGLTVQIGEI